VADGATLFDDVAEVLPSLIPDSLGPVRLSARRWGVKAWFGGSAGAAARPPRAHYEAQLISARDVPAATRYAIEVGWHSEEAKEADNQAALDALVARERTWRKVIGDEAECGTFLGRARNWRRVSETWPDPDLGDLGLGFEVAARLTDYMLGLEPVLRKHAPRSGGT
jgi:hypothetical protein